MRWLPVFIALTWGGCQPANPHEQAVEAGSPGAYNRWLHGQRRLFTPQEQQEWDEIVQEYRYEIMKSREATGSQAIEAGLRKKIDGKPVGLVLRYGYVARELRLQADYEQYSRNYNHQRGLRGVNPESEAYLEQQRGLLKAQVDMLQTKLQKTRSRLAELNALAKSAEDS